MIYQTINSSNQARMNHFIKKHWLSTQMIIRGKIIDMSSVDGVIAFENDKIIGLITYTIENQICEILSLDS